MTSILKNVMREIRPLRSVVGLVWVTRLAYPIFQADSDSGVHGTPCVRRTQNEMMDGLPTMASEATPLSKGGIK
jgi:hypothetical protein